MWSSRRCDRCDAAARAISSHEMTRTWRGSSSRAARRRGGRRRSGRSGAGCTGPRGAGRGRALDHLDRGVAAYRAGDYARARVELTAAQRARARPAQPVPMARADRGRAGRLRERAGRTSRASCRGSPPGPMPGSPRWRRCARRAAHARRQRHRVRTMSRRPRPRRPRLRPRRRDLGAGSSRSTSRSRRARCRAARPRCRSTGQPLVRRWWFWAAVGAVAITPPA